MSLTHSIKLCRIMEVMLSSVVRSLRVMGRGTPGITWKLDESCATTYVIMIIFPTHLVCAILNLRPYVQAGV